MLHAIFNTLSLILTINLKTVRSRYKLPRSIHCITSPFENVDKIRALTIALPLSAFVAFYPQVRKREKRRLVIPSRPGILLSGEGVSDSIILQM